MNSFEKKKVLEQNSIPNFVPRLKPQNNYPPDSSPIRLDSEFESFGSRGGKRDSSKSAISKANDNNINKDACNVSLFSFETTMMTEDSMREFDFESSKQLDSFLKLEEEPEDVLCEDLLSSYITPMTIVSFRRNTNQIKNIKSNNNFVTLLDYMQEKAKKYDEESLNEVHL